MIGGGTVTSCPFPVGFGGFFQIDPNTIYSGTKWEQKKDVFILAAGETYPAGSTGGEAQHTHKYGFQLGTYWGTAVMEGDPQTGALQDGTGSPVGWTSLGALASTVNGNTSESMKSSGANHVKSVADTSSASNLPPYLAMPFWVRTA